MEWVQKLGIKTQPTDFLDVQMLHPDGTPLTDAEMAEAFAGFATLAAKIEAIKAASKNDIPLGEALNTVLADLNPTDDERAALMYLMGAIYFTIVAQ